VLLIGSLIALVVSKTISKPITNIEAVSRKIADLDFSDTADEHDSTAEIASLARSINQMSRRLARNMRELTAANEQLQRDIEYRKQIEGYRREFIASVSHEMKTPLALLQIYTENLKNNVEGIDRDYYCNTILEETENLSRLVSDMLEISSIDNGFLKLNFEAMDLADLCRDILREYRPLLEGFRAEVVLPDSLRVSADIKYLEGETRRHVVGADNAQILENFRFLAERGADLLVRTPLIPGYTATEENIRAIARFLRGIDPAIKYELLNFNPLCRSKYSAMEQDYPVSGGALSEAEMETFRAIAAEEGLTNIIKE